MSANVFAFPGRVKGPQPWTNDELAELYRVVDLLGRAGLSVATDMGMSDEGDPWFVFCRADNEEVIAHFARIDGIFVAASIAVDETFRGANFRQIVDRMVSSQPLVVPPPRPGSRLFVHPAVLLTAFVATALAHSEKTHAQDWLRSVEAQWEHGKESALHSLKQVKTGWFDTLHTLMKLPSLHDARLAYDSAKEGMTLTLASLIAIAMTALQPISDKMAAIAQLVDEFPAHAAEIVHQGAGHIAALAVDSFAIAVGDSGSGKAASHGGDTAHTDSDSPTAHKVQAADAASSDSAKASVDAAHLAAPVVQKAMDDAAAVHPAPVDGQFDANLAALAVQKVVTPPAQAAESIVVHVDTGAISIPTIDLQNVTPDAIRLLDIKVSKADDGSTYKASTPSTDTELDANAHPAASPSADGSGAGNPPAVVVASGGSSSSAPVVAPVGPVSDGNGNQVLDVNSAPGATTAKAISDFVTDGTHSISQQVVISDPIAQQELAGILSVYGSVKVVFFESTNPMPDVFLYSPTGVVFVEEKDLASSSHLSNHGGDLILEGGAAGTITLVGVAIVGHLGTA